MTAKRSILIVEDEEIIRTTLREFLAGEGYAVETAGTVANALMLASGHDFDVAICDVQLPDGDGVNLLRRLQQLHLETFGLIITAYATVENAVEAFKAGAFDYLVKPVIFQDLRNKLERLFRFRELHLENQYLRRELARHGGFDRIIGSSKALTELHDTIRKVAATHANVLLVGETGTGKELFARAIHAAGPKREEKFFAVNCGNRPVELLESQLFGIHAAWNWAQANLFGFEVSGLPPAGGMLFDLMEVGPDVVTGGPFGPEGGLAVTIVLIVSCGFVWLASKRQAREDSGS